MRCYNGCPDKALQAVLDSAADVRKELERIGKEIDGVGCRATWFPMEEKFMVFKGLDPITGFCDNLHAALRETKSALGVPQ